MYIRNIATGKRKMLIKGSGINDKKYPSIIFLKSTDGYDLHFSTRKYEMGEFLHTWYRWNLGQDMLYLLNRFARLPL